MSDRIAKETVRPCGLTLIAISLLIAISRSRGICRSGSRCYRRYETKREISRVNYYLRVDANLSALQYEEISAPSTTAILAGISLAPIINTGTLNRTLQQRGTAALRRASLNCRRVLLIEDDSVKLSIGFMVWRM